MRKPWDKRERKGPGHWGRECGKHGLAPSLWRYYGACSRKALQGHRTVGDRFHPFCRNKALKEETCSSCFGFLLFLIMRKNFRAGKSHRKCILTACLMGETTFALKLKWHLNPHTVNPVFLPTLQTYTRCNLNQVYISERIFFSFSLFLSLLLSWQTYSLISTVTVMELHFKPLSCLRRALLHQRERLASHAWHQQIFKTCLCQVLV